jgi:hypothetical protein
MSLAYIPDYAERRLLQSLRTECQNCVNLKKKGCDVFIKPDRLNASQLEDGVCKLFEEVRTRKSRAVL